MIKAKKPEKIWREEFFCTEEIESIRLVLKGKKKLFQKQSIEDNTWRTNGNKIKITMEQVC